MPKILKNALDDLTLRRLVTKGEPVARADGEGLTFTLSPAGTATWVLRYRQNGRRSELTIGNYPDISLATARKAARELRVEIDRGEDPSRQKREKKIRATEAKTVNELIADFREKKLVGLAPDTIEYRVWDLEKVIGPRIGRLNVDEVKPSDIVHMLERAKRTWTVSKRVLTTTRKLFEHAAGKRLIEISPAVGIDLVAIMGPRPPIRRRVMLTEEELRRLLADVGDLGHENALALRILLATCVRSVELATARWEYVDLDRGSWWIPEESVKTRRGVLVPLPPTVVGWFRQLQELAGASEWVLPARQESRNRRFGGDTHVSKTTLWAALRRAFDRGDLDIRRFTPHDTRSTAKGHMRNLGVSKEISELALNHALKGMEGIYDVREEIPERTEALELWAAFLVACEEGREWGKHVQSQKGNSVNGLSIGG